jgi:tetratricopeptide (TPR) repeat protein
MHWPINCLGCVQVSSNRAAQGIAECERALALDRNLARAHGTIGSAKYFIGRSEEVECHVKQALRLSPRDTVAQTWMALAGAAKLVLCCDDEAVAWLRRAIETNRSYAIAHLWLFAAFSKLLRAWYCPPRCKALRGILPGRRNTGVALRLLVRCPRADLSAAGRAVSAFTAAVAAGSAWSGLRAASHAEVIPPRSGRR